MVFDHYLLFPYPIQNDASYENIQTNFPVYNYMKLNILCFQLNIVAREHINSFGVLVLFYIFHRFNLKHYWRY